MSEKTDAKQRIAAAKDFAKKHHVDVLGWNDKPGKEFISFSGESNRLPALKAEMEKHGWKIWPQGDDEEGWMMEFSLYPPPTDKPESSRSDATPPDDVPVGEEFRFTGLNGLFSASAVSLAIFIIIAVVARVVRSVKITEFGDIVPALTAYAAANPLVVAAALFLPPLTIVPFYWMSVFSSGDTITFRNSLVGKRYVVPYNDIKRVKIYVEKGSRGGKTSYVGVNQKSGSQFDVFLPEKRQKELVSFLRKKANIKG